MSALIVAVVLGVLLAGVAAYFRLFAGWRRVHQAILGALTMFYGMWLALCTGTVFKLVLPGIGSVVLGSAAGVGLGFATFLAVGTVGVATGGVGIAVGAIAMMAIGAVFGGVGGAAGVAVARVPLISPIFWAPVVLVGIYLGVGAARKPKMLAGHTDHEALPPEA